MAINCSLFRLNGHQTFTEWVIRSKNGSMITLDIFTKEEMGELFGGLVSYSFAGSVVFSSSSRLITLRNFLTLSVFHSVLDESELLCTAITPTEAVLATYTLRIYRKNSY